MSVTDLTNTTWKFNDEIPYNGYLRYNINFQSNNDNYVAIQYDEDGFMYRINASIIRTVYNEFLSGPWVDEAYKTITITGGTDVTNATLISWLQSNATQIVEQSFSPNRLYVKCNGNGRPQVKAVVAETEDALAGTWVLNDTPDTSISREYSLNFTSNNNQYNYIKTEDGIGLSYGDNSSGLPVKIIAYNSNPFSSDYGWVNESYKTIIITSKLSEVTKGDTLLAWLQSNATKQSAAQTLTAANSGRLYTKVWIKEPFAAAQNLSVDGTTLTFDEVDGATSYDVYANETLIGEVVV